MSEELPLPERIVRHVSRYRLTTADAIHKLFYQDKTREAAKKAANRLVSSGKLASIRLNRQRVIYCLPEAAPLASQSTWTNYATLLFCVFTDPPKQKILPKQFELHFPEIYCQPGVAPAHQHYFLTMTTPPILGRILTDSDASVERLLRKCRETIKWIEKTDHLRDLYGLSLFRIAVLVAEESKARDVRQALYSDVRSERVEVHHLKPLGDIIDMESQS